MWVVINFEKKYLPWLKKEISDKLNGKPNFFMPKLKLQKFVKNKICNKDSFLLGNYLLCYHENFNDPNTINKLKYCKGLKYFLSCFLKSQKEIKEFVNKCKKHEDKEGYIKQSFFDLEGKKKFQFISGPFTNMIFKIISDNKHKTTTLIGNLKTTVLKNSYLFKSV